jgi:hypothetical protein
VKAPMVEGAPKRLELPAMNAGSFSQPAAE